MDDKTWELLIHRLDRIEQKQDNIIKKLTWLHTKMASVAGIVGVLVAFFKDKIQL